MEGMHKMTEGCTCDWTKQNIRTQHKFDF